MATPKEQHDARKHPVNFGGHLPDESGAEHHEDGPSPKSDGSPIPGAPASATGGRGAAPEPGPHPGH